MCKLFFSGKKHYPNEPTSSGESCILWIHSSGFSFGLKNGAGGFHPVLSDLWDFISCYALDIDRAFILIQNEHTAFPGFYLNYFPHSTKAVQSILGHLGSSVLFFLNYIVQDASRGNSQLQFKILLDNITDFRLGNKVRGTIQFVWLAGKKTLNNLPQLYKSIFFMKCRKVNPSKITLKISPKCKVWTVFYKRQLSEKAKPICVNSTYVHRAMGRKYSWTFSLSTFLSRGRYYSQMQTC